MLRSILKKYFYKEEFVITNEIKIFENPEFGQVRTIEKDGKILFCGSDVAKSLGYARPNDAITAHCRYTVKHSIPHPQSPDKEIKICFIAEGDIYRLIVHSKLPSAAKFECWVFDEVLPSIRKHGAYMTDETLEKALSDPDFLIRLATELKTEKEKRIAAEKENKQLAATNEVLVSDTLTWADRNLINAVIRRYGFSAKNGRFDFAWIEWKKELLYKYGININARITAKTNAKGKNLKLWMCLQKKTCYQH